MCVYFNSVVLWYHLTNVLQRILKSILSEKKSNNKTKKQKAVEQKDFESMKNKYIYICMMHGYDIYSMVTANTNVSLFIASVSKLYT